MTLHDSATCAIPGTPLAAAMPGIDMCVHCGFCLQSCPTYLAHEDENDSPRGRILLMRAVAEGDVPVDDDRVRTHIDRCLGCRACETACPSGVPYGQLLEATRATLVDRQPSPPLARVILWVFGHGVLLRPTLAVAKIFRASGIPNLLSRLPGTLGFAMAMLASTAPRRPAVTTRRCVPQAIGDDGAGAAETDPVSPRGSTAVLLGCVMEGLFAHTNRATERVLAANGYAVVAAPGQRCCGALHAHAGDLSGARALARANIAAFERSGAETIAVNAAGCGAILKEYDHLLADEPEWAQRAAAIAVRVRDVSELLAAAGPKVGTRIVDARVAYDAPCHLIHAQRIEQAPLRVLNAIRGITLVPLDEADQCCGAAGIYNLIEPYTSNLVLARKLNCIRDANTDWVATGNPGCLMQIGGGLRQARMAVASIHPVELLDASYES
ncbi:MAG: heterodisulfide reductase-related iron-sulfur binding cluster [Gemmatimonadaceae bacterium]